MLSKYKHISFDLDGTLVHTVPEYRHQVVPEVVKALGGNIKAFRDVDRFWFEAGRDKIIKNSFGLDPGAFWHLFREKDKPEFREIHTRAYDDVRPVLNALKSAGKIVSIITGAPGWIAEMEIRKLDKANIDIYYPIDRTVFADKPDPRSFLHVLEKLRVSPEETVYIGNSNEDAYFAHQAGTAFVYLERKEHEFELDKYSIAKIESLNELLNME